MLLPSLMPTWSSTGRIGCNCMMLKRLDKKECTVHFTRARSCLVQVNKMSFLTPIFSNMISKACRVNHTHTKHTSTINSKPPARHFFHIQMKVLHLIAARLPQCREADLVCKTWIGKALLVPGIIPCHPQ